MAKVKCDTENEDCKFRKDGVCTAKEISVDFDGQYWNVDCPEGRNESVSPTNTV